MYGNYNAYPWSRWIKWGAIALIIIIVVSIFAGTYNGLMQADQNVKASWSQVENVMQRRADVINNTVETVKGEVAFEKDVIDKITSARSVLLDKNASIGSKLNADDEMKNIVVLIEDNPEFKAHASFENLQTAIEGSENRVSVERRNFIQAVQTYNTKVTRFPGNIFAGLMGFKPADYFEASPGAQEAPKVKF